MATRALVAVLAAAVLPGCAEDDFVAPTFQVIGPGVHDGEIWYLPGHAGGVELDVDRGDSDTDVLAWTYLVWGKIHLGEIDLRRQPEIPLFADDELGDGEIALHDGPGHFLGLVPTHVVYPDGGTVTANVNFTGELIYIEPLDTIQVLAGDVARVSVEYSLRDLYPAGAGLLVTDDPAARPLLGSERDSLELLGRDGTYRITLGAGPTWRQAIDVRGLRNSDVVASIFPPEGGQEPGTYISLGMRVLDAQGAPVLYDHVTVGDSKDDWFSPGYYYDPLAAPRTVTMIAGRPGNLVRATKIIHPRQAF